MFDTTSTLRHIKNQAPALSQAEDACFYLYRSQRGCDKHYI